METWIASLLVLTAGILIGYYYREARDQIAKQAQNIVRHETNEPQSSILEPPLTPSEKVIREQEELLERLNPS